MLRNTILALASSPIYTCGVLFALPSTFSEYLPSRLVPVLLRMRSYQGCVPWHRRAKQHVAAQVTACTSAKHTEHHLHPALSVPHSTFPASPTSHHHKYSMQARGLVCGHMVAEKQIVQFPAAKQLLIWEGCWRVLLHVHAVVVHLQGTGNNCYALHISVHGREPRHQVKYGGAPCTSRTRAIAVHKGSAGQGSR